MVCSFWGENAITQTEEKSASEQMETILEELTEDQKNEILAKALTLSGKGGKKRIMKALKKMSPENQKQLLEFAENVNKPAPRVAPVNPAPAQLPTPPAGPLTTITFKEKTFDFGTIVSGEKISYKFQFTNSGDQPLIISNAKGSCGCTVPMWPKKPIPVGGSGEIEVVFDSKNKKGPRNQKVTLTANTDPPQTFIFLKGNVVTE